MKTGIATAAIALVLVACGASYDEDGFDQVITWYSAAALAASDGAYAASEYMEHDEVDRIPDAISTIDNVTAAHRDLPDRDEIRSWSISEHQIEGEDLDSALHRAADNLGALATDLDFVLHDYERGIEDDREENIVYLFESITDTHDVLEELDEMLP